MPRAAGVERGFVGTAGDVDGDGPRGERVAESGEARGSGRGRRRDSPPRSSARRGIVAASRIGVGVVTTVTGGGASARPMGASSVAAVARIDRRACRGTSPIVMDGNGRWAQRRGLKRTDGHAAGEEALFDTVEGGLDDRAAVDDRVRLLAPRTGGGRSTRSAS